MKIKNKITAFILLTAALLPAAQAQTIEALRGKIAVEAQIEERLNTMLSSYLNTKDLAVAAKINLMVRKPEEQKGGVRKWDDKDDIILPGVPAATSMTKDAGSAKAVDAAGNKMRLGVESVNIWVMVGKPITKEQEARIKKLVTEALGLEAAAGDTIAVESASSGKLLRELPGLGQIIALICLAVLAVFLYGPFRAFLKRFNDNLAALSSSHKGPAEKSGGGEITISGDELPAETTMSGALAISGGGGASVLSFDSGENIPLEKYVTKDNVDDLILILSDEPAEVIARVVQRIPQKLAFAAIPKHKMREVLEQFLKRDFVEPEKIKALLERIKDKMAGSFGGEQRLGNLMQIMDKKSQTRTLTFIRELDASFAAAVETRYFKFEDLLRYDEMAIRRVFRKAGAEAFARCMKNCDAPTLEAFYEALGPAIKDLINARMQNMLLTGDTNDSELTILSAVQALAAKGLILPLADVKQIKA